MSVDKVEQLVRPSEAEAVVGSSTQRVLELVKQLQSLLREESQEAVRFVKEHRRGMGRIRHLGNAETLLIRFWQSYVAAASEIRIPKDITITTFLSQRESSLPPHTELENSEHQERESSPQDRLSPAPSSSGDAE